MWAMHQTHDDKFVPGRNSRQDIFKESISSKKTPAEKIVTFSTLQEKENTEYKPEPQLKVKDEPLRDAKAYLAQYSDFRQGGMQGS